MEKTFVFVAARISSHVAVLTEYGCLNVTYGRIMFWQMDRVLISQGNDHLLGSILRYYVCPSLTATADVTEIKVAFPFNFLLLLNAE